LAVTAFCFGSGSDERNRQAGIDDSGQVQPADSAPISSRASLTSCTASAGGRPFPKAASQHLTTVFKRLLRSAGLPHKRIHDLRHTAATNMLRHGVPIKAVQDVLNHSTAKLTLGTYAHLVPGMTKEALLAWAAVLKGSAEVA